MKILLQLIIEILLFISDFILNDVKIITNRNDLILNNNYAGNK